MDQTMHSGGTSSFDPVGSLLGFFELYGWYLLGFAVVGCYLMVKILSALEKWQVAREDAKYHKDPDMALARMEAIQQARDKQQRLLLEASQRALEQQKEREERKRQENAERLEKYGAAAGSQRLGSGGDYLPLSGGASTSSYKPQKRSKCGGGGCGK